MKKLLIILACVLLPACASGTYSKNFNLAQNYQDDGRFELAKQYYLLALASAQNNDQVMQVENKLFAVERQIITLR